jgi:hypothetical protein
MNNQWEGKKMNFLGRKIAVVVLLLGLASIALGGYFVQLGFEKANYLAGKMVEQNITYTAAGGDIVGAIDTPREAQVMANVLQEHSQALGNYSQLKRDDPNRQQILNALTMTNSLEMAVMGFGLTDVVKASGAFMILVGAGFLLISIPGLRRRKTDSQ